MDIMYKECMDILSDDIINKFVGYSCLNQMTMMIKIINDIADEYPQILDEFDVDMVSLDKTETILTLDYWSKTKTDKDGIKITVDDNNINVVIYKNSNDTEDDIVNGEIYFNRNIALKYFDNQEYTDKIIVNEFLHNTIKTIKKVWEEN